MTTELDPRAAGGKRLKGKICIVTGAGQGIGRAAAKRLGEEGGAIVVADRVDEGAAVDSLLRVGDTIDEAELAGDLVAFVA